MYMCIERSRHTEAAEGGRICKESQYSSSRYKQNSPIVGFIRNKNKTFQMETIVLLSDDSSFQTSRKNTVRCLFQ